MPFSIEMDGLDELIHKMDRLPEKAADVAALALYDSAGVVADKVSAGVRGISTEPFSYARGGQKRKPSPEEKAIIASADMGVAKFNKSPTRIETSVGLRDEYTPITWNHARTNVRTKYKMGSDGKAKQAGKGSGTSVKPVYAIANAINSGTSFMEKQPFMRKAFSQSKSKAEAAFDAGVRKHEDMLDF